jgi:hypothetical protein
MRTSISRGLMMSSLMLALAACATATPYQPLKDGVGYGEQRIESNRYKVTFSGNSNTPRQTVENYLLYRAAEVTLQNGYDYFVQADSATDAQTSYTQLGTGFGGYRSYWSPFYGPGFGFDTSSAIPRTEYEAQASILVFKGPKPADNYKAFDAREVKANLEATIARPPQQAAKN